MNNADTTTSSSALVYFLAARCEFLAAIDDMRAAATGNFGLDINNIRPGDATAVRAWAAQLQQLAAVFAGRSDPGNKPR